MALAPCALILRVEHVGVWVARPAALLMVYEAFGRLAAARFLDTSYTLPRHFLDTS